MNKKQILVLLLVIALMMFVFFSPYIFDSQDIDTIDTKTIGFINPDADNSYYAGIEGTVRETAAEKGWEFITLDAAGDDSRIFTNAEALVTRRVDVAVTFNNMSRFPSDAADIFADAGIPFVVLDNPLDNAIYCGYDYIAAGEELGKELSTIASNRFDGTDLVITISNVAPSYASKKYMEAAVETLKSETQIADGYIATISSSTNTEDISNQLNSVFSDSPDLSKIIIICENAEFAKAASGAVQANGYAEKVVIGSFSNMDLSSDSLSDPWICSIVLSDSAVQQALIQKVIQIIEKNDLSDSIIDSELVKL